MQSRWYRAVARLLVVIVIASLLPGAPLGASTPDAQAAAPEPSAARTTRPAPALRPHGSPPSSFVPAALRATPRTRFAFAPPTADPESLMSKGRPATASSFFSEPDDGGRQFSPRLAVDGDLSSAWGSSPDEVLPQWWQVDVGKTYTMTRLLTHWASPDSQSYDYRVEVSADGTNYTQVASRSGASGQTTDTFSARGRYLRVTIII